MFSEKGKITDVQLKYTKDGVFRQFAFIGYETEDEATVAAEHFDNTCLQTNRLKVEICAALGSNEKPKAFSKYSADKLVEGKEREKAIADEKEKSKIKRKTKNDRIGELFAEHKNDPKFIEFMKIHSKGNEIWDNDLGLGESEDGPPIAEVASHSKIVKYDNNEEDESDEEGNENETDDNDKTSAKTANMDISDSEYLKSLTKKSEEIVPTPSNTTSKKVTDAFTIKIRGIPFKTKRQDVIKFFKPLKPFSIRLPSRIHGICYVGFKTERELKKALLKDRSFLSGKQVFLNDFTEANKKALAGEINENKPDGKQSSKNQKWQKQEEALKNEEDISESGKIFFRNLAYTVNDKNIQELFEKYGPIADCNLPIDPVTRKIKGFGTVTFVMPENAVSAFNELDGSIFHGRLLHLIPGKSNKEDEEESNTDDMSYKKKKLLEQKKTAGSSHNWNSLFIGTDAVANRLATNYGTTKEAVMDTAGGGSNAAVRLALGETELIIEMRKFLEENDVVLDVFNQASTKRSKTVILVKNLPTETTVNELQVIFKKFGLVGRLVLPPSGVTAIVEYLDAIEAKKAFSKLAYSKFKNLPLYLEWAPENTFKSVATKPMTITDDIPNVDANKEKKSNDSNPFKKGANLKPAHYNDNVEKETYVLNDVEEQKEVIEVKNNRVEDDGSAPEAGTTLFLRNLNFSTREDAVRDHFKHIGPIHHIQVAIKKDPDNPCNKIALGYGFIQFKLKKDTEKALKNMLTTQIDGNTVELKRSDRMLS